MNDAVTLYQLAPSPNSIKARLALAFKAIPHETVDLGPTDRATPIKLSGQPLLPVLTHGTRVIYDSYGIVRYLDANWPQGPRLFSSDRDTQQAIEGWELFTRADLTQAIRTIFGQLIGGTEQADAFRAANVQLAQAALKLEEALERGEWLVGDGPTAADLTCAPCAYYGLIQTPRSPVESFFARHLRLGDAYPRTRAWVERVMAWDSHPSKA